MKVKIVFLGLNEFGLICLENLIRNKFTINKIIVPEDNRISKIQSIAEEKKIEFLQLTKGMDLEKEIKSALADIVVISSFNKFIKMDLLNNTKFGCINIHPSLLPAYRGAHPINWALIKDEKETGVTIHYIDKGADTGDIIAQEKISINVHDNILTLKKKIAVKGVKLLIKILSTIERTGLKPIGVKQDDALATFAPKRTPADGKITWDSSSRAIFSKIRALQQPGMYAYSNDRDGSKIDFLKCFNPRSPGKVLAKINGYYLISSNDGVIMVKTNKKLIIGKTLD